MSDIKKLLFARAYAYNSADYCIDTGALSPEEVADKAEKLICKTGLI
jgi:hypothetical protein